MYTLVRMYSGQKYNGFEDEQDIVKSFYFQRSPAGVRAAIIMMQGLLFLVAVSAAGLAYQGGEAVSGFMSALLFTIQSLMSRIGYKYRCVITVFKGNIHFQANLL